MHGSTSKLSILPKLVYRFNTIPTKLLTFFIEFDRLVLKFMYKNKGHRITKQTEKQFETNWKKKKVGGLTLTDSRASYKATFIKTMQYWDKDRHLDQWIRIESP